MGLGVVRVQILVSLDGQYVHGWNGFGDTLGEASEMAVISEREINIGIIVNQSLFLFGVG